MILEFASHSDHSHHILEFIITLHYHIILAFHYTTFQVSKKKKKNHNQNSHCYSNPALSCTNLALSL